MPSTTHDAPHSRQNRRNAKMAHNDCFRVLGVTPNASWEEVRRAYKDLVRVWHPDRFQSDLELRERAEHHLQQINEAYLTLKSADIFIGRQPEPPPPPPPSASNPPARRGLQQFLWILQTRWLVKAFVIGVLCLTPLLFLSLVLNALRVPTLDSVLPGSGIPRPALLTPSRIVNPFGDKSTTIDALSAWARGEGVDLWRSIPKIGEHPSTPSMGAANASPAKDDAAPPGQQPHRDAAPPAPVMPVNGTELLWTRRSGAGELWISNDTSRDAYATLVQAHTAAPQRAIYIQAKNQVCMRNIAPGLYNLLAEVGENWDPHRIRFRAARQPLGRSGPFDFFDVTSSQGSSGRTFNVVLRTR